MISNRQWKADYEKELEHARMARKEGNEGMARVCARRAAGIVIGEYLRRRGITGLTNSAYDRLTLLNNLPDVPEPYKEISQHFLIKVDHAHRLPANIQLLDDAAWLRQALLKDYDH